MRLRVIVMLAGSLPSVSLLAGAQRALAADRSPAEILNETEQVRLPEQDSSKLEESISVVRDNAKRSHYQNHR